RTGRHNAGLSWLSRGGLAGVLGTLAIFAHAGRSAKVVASPAHSRWRSSLYCRCQVGWDASEALAECWDPASAEALLGNSALKVETATPRGVGSLRRDAAPMPFGLRD